MKKLIPIIAVIGILALIALLLFNGAPAPDTEEATPPAATSTLVSTEETIEKGEEDDRPTPTSAALSQADIPTPTADDVAAAIYDESGEAELKFLTTRQKEELTASAITDYEPQIAESPTYSVEWTNSDTEIDIQIPESLPVYLLERPTDKSLLEVVQEMGETLGIKGVVVRLNEQTYTITDLLSADYFLYYDVFHLTFDAEGIAASISGSGAQAVADALNTAGLLRFPYSTSEETDRFGENWIRFTPDLPLPVITLNTPAKTGSYEPKEAGSVNVQMNDSGDIENIYHYFPNIVEKDVLDTASTENLSATIAAGVFELGKVELQYPGAIPIEDRRAFFESLEAQNISITGAEVNGVECGYYLETGSSVQAVLAPVCVVDAVGRVGNYSVIFQGIVPAI